MASIMASDMVMYMAAPAGWLWPGIAIQAIDMVQPPASRSGDHDKAHIAMSVIAGHP
jgi:hypothetical protein